MAEEEITTGVLKTKSTRTYKTVMLRTTWAESIRKDKHQMGRNLMGNTRWIKKNLRPLISCGWKLVS